MFNQSDLGFLHLEEKRLALFSKILPPDSPYYDEKACLQYLKEELLDEAKDRDLLPVWSNELLSGWPSYGSQTRVLIAERLVSMFPDAKILLIIREQKSVINSVYGQYIREGGTMNLKTYLSKEWVAPYFQGFNLVQYDYFQLVSLYTRLFKPENVLFLPYELLNKDSSAFIKSILNFAELDHEAGLALMSKNVLNKTTSDSNLWLRRHVGKFVSNRRSVSNQNAVCYNFHFKKMWKSLELPRFVDTALKRKKSTIIQAHIGNTFQESNNSLQELTDVDFKSLGYDL